MPPRAPKIYLEGKVAIAGDLPFRHSYLTFEVEDGSSYVIRGGPRHSWLPEQGFGTVVTERSVEISQSKDQRAQTVKARNDRGGVELDIGSANPHLLWAKMNRLAEDIEKALIDYVPIGPNSNSVIWTILRSFGYGSVIPNEMTMSDDPSYHYRSYQLYIYILRLKSAIFDLRGLYTVEMTV